MKQLEALAGGLKVHRYCNTTFHNYMTKLGREGVHVTGKLGQLSGLIVDCPMDAWRRI